jgi:type IV secretory pathway TrbD component
MPEKSKKKSKNPIIAYFMPFGLRQATDLLMIVGAIVIFAGLLTHAIIQANITMYIGLSMYIVGSAIAIYRCLRVLLRKDINRRSVEHKNAVINIVVMGVFLILSVLGICAAAFFWGAI